MSILSVYERRSDIHMPVTVLPSTSTGHDQSLENIN